MSGWGDPDKLAEARAAHVAFTGRSPGSRGPGSRRGRGHGSTPSPARGFNNSDNMMPAGRGRSGPPNPASGGNGGFSNNNTARASGSGDRNRSAATLMDTEQFFAHLNNEKKTHTHPGGPTAVSETPGASADPTSQKTVAMNANEPGGPMEVDMHAQSSNTAISSPIPGHSPMASQWGDAPGTLGAAQGNGVTGTTNSEGSMGLDISTHVQTNATLVKSESLKRGLMSSHWNTTKSKDTQSKSSQPKSAQSKDARSTADTKHGLFASQWAEPPPPPTNPSELPPVYRSNDWVNDLIKENEAEAKRRAASFPAGLSSQANGHSRGTFTEPAQRTTASPSVGAHAQTRPSNAPAQGAASATAFTVASELHSIPARLAAHPAPVSGLSMQGHAFTQRPNAIQPGTQSVSQQSAGFGQLPVGAAHPGMGHAQAYQPSSAPLPTQGRPHQSQVATAFPTIGAHASPNAQAFQNQGFGATSSSAGFGASPTQQLAQQPAQPIGGNNRQHLPQTASPLGGDAGPQSTQSPQGSEDPFNDPEFMDWWKGYSRKNDKS
ncbi:hypothetical protein VP1G_09844 [Cytospora mali]|uniref:Uncharacterized protein n=1 Tax=Cytospora mali TaxID=578113 RepID=A0A194VG05_CYTMA|nr:hypothetical protein VP1G_09844 [Valsa mali var. pyri (nom. inval.)]